MSDSDEPFGQNVQEKAAEELDRIERHHAGLARFSFDSCPFRRQFASHPSPVRDSHVSNALEIFCSGVHFYSETCLTTK